MEPETMHHQVSIQSARRDSFVDQEHAGVLMTNYAMGVPLPSFDDLFGASDCPALPSAYAYKSKAKSS